MPPRDRFVETVRGSVRRKYLRAPNSCRWLLMGLRIGTDQNPDGELLLLSLIMEFL